MSSSEEEEEVLVHVEFDGIVDKDVLDRSPVFFKMIGVEERRPIMQIGNQTFAGEYRDVVGTALFFEENPNPPVHDPVFSRTPEHELQYFCKTRKSLHMSRVFLKRLVKNDAVPQPDPNDVAIENEGNSGSSPLDEVMMEVDDSAELFIHKKTTKDLEGHSDAAEPSLTTLMEATMSRNLPQEVSALIEGQLQITSDQLLKSAQNCDESSGDR